MGSTGNLVGRCGVFCGTCRLYILTKCKGCLNDFAKETKCTFYVCAEDKQLGSCGKCGQFPCLDHYGSSQVFSKKKLLDWKKREVQGRSKGN